jgi:hypothetical protein
MGLALFRRRLPTKEYETDYVQGKADYLEDRADWEGERPNYEEIGLTGERMM